MRELDPEFSHLTVTIYATHSQNFAMVKLILYAYQNVRKSLFLIEYSLNRGKDCNSKVDNVACRIRVTF